MSFNTRYIDYYNYIDSIKDQVSGCTYSNLQTLTQRDFKNIQEDVIQILSRFNFDAVVYNPTEVIKSVASTTKHYFSNDAALYLSKIWPPVVKKSNEFIPEIFNFFVEIAHQLSNQDVLFKWISCGIFSNNWSKCDPKIHTLVATKGFLEDDPNTSIFFQLTMNGTAKVYNIRTNELSKIPNITNIDIDEAKDTVSFYNKNDKKIFGFILEDNSSIKFWPSILRRAEFRQNPFLSPPQGPYPSVFLNDFAKLVVKPDSTITRALLTMINGDPVKMREVLPHLYNIYMRYHSVIGLFNLVVVLDLEYSYNKIHYLTRDGSLTHLLFELIVGNCSAEFDDQFLNKLIQYIDKNKNINLETQNQETTVTFFSTFKYIMNCISFIPSEIRLMLSVIKSYCSLVDNNREKIYKVITSLFLNQTVREYVRKVYKDDDNALPYQIVFHVCKIISKKKITLKATPEWEKRIREKVFPKIDRFAVLISEFKSNSQPPTKRITELEKELSVKAIISYINLNFTVFTKIVEDFSIPTKCYSSCLGWNLSVAVSRMFVCFGDDKQIENIQKELSQNPKKEEKIVESESDSEKPERKMSLNMCVNVFSESIQSPPPKKPKKKKTVKKKKITYVYVNKKVYRHRTVPNLQK